MASALTDGPLPAERPRIGPGRPVAAALLAGLLVGPGFPESASATEADGERDGWELVWADEFDGPDIDGSSWNLEVMPDPHNEELQYYTDRKGEEIGANARVDDGMLVIEARSEDFGHRSYTSARLNTKGKREFRYGRFEARLRQPSAVGTWPAFWLLGGNIDTVGWPACGEIDVMEGKGRLPAWTSGAVHFGPDPEGHRFVAHEHRLDSGSFQEDWHDFAVEWEPGEIRWLVDDEVVETLERPGDVAAETWPFDRGHPFFVIVNLAVGGWFDPGHPPPVAMEPQRLLVDHVRVYRRRSPTSETSGALGSELRPAEGGG